MNFDDLPIKVIEQVELATGYLIEELFQDDNKSPFRKRAIAYLTALGNGQDITWEQMGDKTISELVALMEIGTDDEKKDV